MSDSEIAEYNKKFAEIEPELIGGLERQKIYKTGISILLAAGLIAAINYLRELYNTIKRYKDITFKSDIKHAEPRLNRHLEYDMSSLENFKKSFEEKNKEIIDRLKKYHEYDEKYDNFIYICNGVDWRIIYEAKKYAEDLIKQELSDENKENILGKGSYGTVFKWKYDDKEYALKINGTFYGGHTNIHPIKFSEIYINDCLNIRGNNVKIYGGCNLNDSVPFILMEKLDIIKWNKNAVLEKRDRLDYLNIINILQLAEISVSDLHEGNILKTKDGRMIISDFGVINDGQYFSYQFFPKVFHDYFKSILGTKKYDSRLQIHREVIEYYIEMDNETKRIEKLNEIFNLMKYEDSKYPGILEKKWEKITPESEADFIDFLEEKKIIIENDIETMVRYSKISNEEQRLRILAEAAEIAEIKFESPIKINTEYDVFSQLSEIKSRNDDIGNKLLLYYVKKDKLIEAELKGSLDFKEGTDFEQCIKKFIDKKTKLEEKIKEYEETGNFKKRMEILNKLRKIYGYPYDDIQLKTEAEFLDSIKYDIPVKKDYTRVPTLDENKKKEFYTYLNFMYECGTDICPDSNLKLMYEFIKLNPEYEQQPNKTKSPPMFFGGDYYFIYILIIVIIILIILLMIYINKYNNEYWNFLKNTLG